MKDNLYYVRYALTFFLTYLAISLVLGEFFPFLKSLIVNDADSAAIFSRSLEEVNWTKRIYLPLVMGIGIALYRQYSENKTTSTK